MSQDPSPETLIEDTLLNIDSESLSPENKALGSATMPLPIIPLVRRPFFPGMAAPLVIEPGAYYELLKAVANSEFRYLGLLLTRKENQNIYKLDFEDLYETGVLARVLRIIPIEQGGAQVVLNIEKRFKVRKKIKRGKHLLAEVDLQQDPSTSSDELKAYAINIITTIKELLKLNPLFRDELQVFLGHSDFTEPGKLADFAVALTTASREELQEVLETFNVQARIDKALLLLKKELDLTRLQNNINQKIEATISKSQKEFFLREQMKTIKRELGGEKDEKTSDAEKFEARLKERKAPLEVQNVVKEELSKLASLEPSSPEYSVCRNYLDWLTIVPWGITSQDSHDLAKAEEILDEDHYGLREIKQRILEFISIGALSGNLKGSILCLVGPPGVGKTSIGRSIARALGRKFYRFSVGGMRDEAEIKGHRRTYIGAMPGKLIQALKYTQTANPVIMLDEIDKIGNSYHGDPASALLEVLDPEQNAEFLDHYLDVRCNLSDVLFIVTANVLDAIPEPLKDRMEILRLSGYIMEEKLQIAKNFLIPRNRKNMGLLSKQVEFTDKGLRTLINGYAREAGVRALENCIKKILRKVAMNLIKARQTSKSRSTKNERMVRITHTNLQEYLKKPLFLSDRLYPTTPVGVCTGLAWTSYGGATCYIETIKIPSEKTEMKLTGQAGQVMRESSEIAWSYLHSALERYAPGKLFFNKCQVHIHIPEGATPKDGPSAGITMVTALLSLLTDTPVRSDLGMTGELTVTGRVLAIGGLKEKLVAARRAGLKVIIFPKENLNDFDELSEEIKEGLEFHFVDHYDQIVPIAFPKWKKRR